MRTANSRLVRQGRLIAAAFSIFVSCAFPPRAAAQASTPAPQIVIDDDGTYHLPAQAIPASSYLSPEGKASLLYYDNGIRDPKIATHNPNGTIPLFKPYRDRQAALYPLDKQDTKIGNVHVFVYTPKDGVSARNKNRVLIELHGGGCWLDCGALESQPIAYLGKIKVVSVDYRENPQVPSGVEDVASVYAALLKTYRAKNIGIYGCSAGGILTARSLVWFQRQNLPNPGGAGILCAGADGLPHGDALYTAVPLGEGHFWVAGSGPRNFNSGDPNDPVVAPIKSAEMLAKYPPTLIVTGTRAMDLSSAVYTHEQLVKLGVDAELHVIEGGRHGFWYDPSPPEAQHVYDVIIKFFDRHLGTAASGKAAESAVEDPGAAQPEAPPAKPAAAPQPPSPSQASQEPEIVIDADGTYHIPAETVPVTSYLSPEGQASLVYYDKAVRDPKRTTRDSSGQVLLFKPDQDSQAKMFPLDRKDHEIAGVRVFEYTPKDGVAPKNKDRVLINLHGGGFSACWLDCGMLESQPIAYLGKIKVISIDYRQAPDFKFPAASEDVARVYAELLKVYRRENIGIYGCSAGGMLTAQSLAWFAKHNLPMPGAAGIFCASADGNVLAGDSAYFQAELGEGRMPQQMLSGGSLGYFSEADMNDPLVSPIKSDAIMSKFPPTLLLTGTRAMEMSSAVFTHARLVQLGVDAQLYMVEGGRHGFWYDPVPPESTNVYNVILKFFDTHLGRVTPLTVAKGTP